MNLSNNFLNHVNGSDMIIHQQHIPQFDITGEPEVFEIESNSTTASINEFIQPKNYNQQMPYTSSPKKDKELNLSDYFKSLQM